MAFTPFTMTKQIRLFRTTPSGQQIALTIEPGTVVRQEQTETETDYFTVVRYTHDGFVWERSHRVPKNPITTPVATNGNGTPKPKPTPTPSAPMSAAKPLVQQTALVKEVVSETARQIHNGMDALSARQIQTKDKVEEHVRRLDRTVKMLTGKIWRVNYYIPDGWAKIAGYTNMLKVFKQRCIYWDDGSNWLFDDEGLNHPDTQEVFQLWRSLKPIVSPSTLPGFTEKVCVRFSTTELTREQFEVEKEGAKEQLAQALKIMHRSLLERIETAATNLEKAKKDFAEKGVILTEKDDSKLDNAYHGALRSAVNTACGTFEQCLRGAELFDDTGSLDAIIEASRNALAVTAMGINLILQAKNAKGVAVSENVNKPYNASIGHHSPR